MTLLASLITTLVILCIADETLKASLITTLVTLRITDETLKASLITTLVVLCIAEGPIPSFMKLQGLTWQNIWSADNPVQVSNEHLSLLAAG